MTTFLEAERIVLRRLTKDDIPTWHRWFNDPQVTRFMNKGLVPNTEAAQAALLEAMSQSPSDVQLAIVSRADDRLIGLIGIHRIDWVHRHGDMSVVIGDREYWSQGVAAEAIGALCEHAFTKLNLHKITAGLWEPNVPCRRAFEKNGFVLEGVMKEQFFCQDEYVNEIRLGLVRTDWLKLERA